MTVRTFQYLLPQGTATLIVPRWHAPQDVTVHNHDHATAKNIYLGGSGVSATTGFDIDAEVNVNLTLPAGDELWAFTNEIGGAAVHVLAVNK